MKKVLALLAAAAMMLSITACGGKNVTKSDMSKIEGKNTTAVENEDGTNSSASISDCDVSIEDSKIIDTDEGKAIVVTINFKNNTSHEESFNGLFETSATQNDISLARASAVVPQDGIDLLASSTMVKKGDSASAQVFYMLDDEESEVTVTVNKYGEPSEGIITKTFDIK